MIRLIAHLCIGFAVVAYFDLSSSCAQQQAEETKRDSEFEREDIRVKVSDRYITVTILSPSKDKLAKHPALLMTFSTRRHASLFTEPFCLTTRAFLEHGHRVLSFDLPCHGERVDRFGKWIDGLRNSFVAEVDPFEMFVQDGQAVITECIVRGRAVAGRIAVQGVSRGGYMAFRLLTADKRIAMGIGMAPVTDWRVLSEFASIRDRQDVAALRLTHFVKKMAGKRVYLAIGNQDSRVGTAACRDFYHALKKAQTDAGYDASYVQLNLTDDPGHSINSGYPRGIEFLLKWSGKQSIRPVGIVIDPIVPIPDDEDSP